jgi:predicted HAD superfamily phosphohydrolase YqeG
VGDQYLTDIAGANLAGIRSIKVPTIGRRSFPLPVRFLQWSEELLFRTVSSIPPRRAIAFKSASKQNSL